MKQNLSTTAEHTNVHPLFYAILAGSKSQRWKHNIDTSIKDPISSMALRLHASLPVSTATGDNIPNLGLTPLLLALFILDIPIVQYLMKKYIRYYYPSTIFVWNTRDSNNRGLLFYVYWAILRLKHHSKWRFYLDFFFISTEWKMRFQMDGVGGHISLYESDFLKGLLGKEGVTAVIDALYWLHLHKRFHIYEKDLLNLASNHPSLLDALLRISSNDEINFPRPHWNRRLAKRGPTLMTCALRNWDLSISFNSQILQKLLKYIDPHLPDGKGCIPLDLAMAGRHHWFVKKLIEYDPPYLRTEIGPYLPGIPQEELESFYTYRNTTSTLVRYLHETRAGPRQIEPIDLARLIMKQSAARNGANPQCVEGFTVTQKADGLYRANSELLLKALPATIQKIPRLLVEAEECKVKQITIFYIFNIQGDHPQLRDKSYPNRMAWLRYEAGVGPLRTDLISSKHDFVEKTKTEHQLIANHITSITSNHEHGHPGVSRVLWWPKVAYNFPDLRLVWEISQIINPSQRSKDEMVLPDDGVILCPDFCIRVVRKNCNPATRIERIWKFKPLKEISIDLILKTIKPQPRMHDRNDNYHKVTLISPPSTMVEGALYRCRWSEQRSDQSLGQLSEGWTVNAEDIRLDKKLPNTSETVAKLTRYHLHPWTYDNVIALVASMQGKSLRTFYGPQQNINIEIPIQTTEYLNTEVKTNGHLLGFFSAIRNWSESSINCFLGSINLSQILDIGSGSHPLRFLKGINYKKYIGLDLDPFILKLKIENPNLSNSPKITYFWANMCSNLRAYECMARDMPSLWTYFYPNMQTIPDLKSDVCLNLHTLHYVIPRGRAGWTQYMRNIDHQSRTIYPHHPNSKNQNDPDVGRGSYWIILFNDADLTPLGSYNIGNAHIQIVKISNQQNIASPIASDKVCNYHYPWIHGNDTTEISQDYLISGTALKKELAFWDWYPISNFSASGDSMLTQLATKNSQIKEWIGSYTMIIFEKIPLGPKA